MNLHIDAKKCYYHICNNNLRIFPRINNFVFFTTEFPNRCIFVSVAGIMVIFCLCMFFNLHNITEDAIKFGKTGFYQLLIPLFETKNPIASKIAKRNTTMTTSFGNISRNNDDNNHID